MTDRPDPERGFYAPALELPDVPAIVRAVELLELHGQVDISTRDDGGPRNQAAWYAGFMHAVTSMWMAASTDSEDPGDFTAGFVCAHDRDMRSMLAAAALEVQAVGGMARQVGGFMPQMQLHLSMADAACEVANAALVCAAEISRGHEAEPVVAEAASRLMMDNIVAFRERLGMVHDLAHLTHARLHGEDCGTCGDDATGDSA